MDKGIWKYNELFDYDVIPKDRLSDDEGNTPLESYPKLAAKIGVETLHLKREDKNPTGSHKDRMMAYMMSMYGGNSNPDGIGPQFSFAISSSGNAAISALSYGGFYNAKLYIFISPNTPQSKIDRLRKTVRELTLSQTRQQMITEEDESSPFPKVFYTDTPSSDAFKFAKDNKLVLLRGSTDKYATQGLRTIAKELVDSAKTISDIFIPCSSGTTVAAIYEGFIKMGITAGKIPRIHAVQTTAVHPIAQDFDTDFKPTEKSIAKAIVDKVAHRKTEVTQILKATKGSAWAVSDEEIDYASLLLEKEGVICSNEGAMTLAAIIKAKKAGWEITKPICIITGVK